MDMHALGRILCIMVSETECPKRVDLGNMVSKIVKTQMKQEEEIFRFSDVHEYESEEGQEQSSSQGGQGDWISIKRSDATSGGPTPSPTLPTSLLSSPHGRVK